MASKSPVSAASQQKASSNTPDAAPSTNPTSPHSLAFPSPQTFDFLPPLHALLLRLLSSTSTSTANNQPATGGGDASTGTVTVAGGGDQGQTQQQQQKVVEQQANGGSSSQTISHPAAGDSGLLGTSTAVLPPLEAKNLPTAASAIKIRIQKARAAVENMPDVERSVDEQAQEIDELQKRIEKLKSVIADFGRRASGKENDEMDTRV